MVLIPPTHTLQSFEKTPPHPLIYASFVPDGPYTEGLKRFDLIRPHGRYTVGRNNAHFILEVAHINNHLSSRNHCDIRLGRNMEEGVVEIVDHSTNGVLVNGKRIEPRVYRRLENGDSVIFGPPVAPGPDDAYTRLLELDGNPPRHYRYIFHDFTSAYNGVSFLTPPGLTERQLAFRASYEEYSQAKLFLERMHYRLKQRYPDYLSDLTQDTEHLTTRFNHEDDPREKQREETPVLEIPPPLESEECKKIIPDVELVEDRNSGAPHIYHGDIIWRGKVHIRDAELQKKRPVSEMHLWSFVHGLPLSLHPNFEDFVEDLWYYPPQGENPRRDWKIISIEARHERERKAKLKLRGDQAMPPSSSPLATLSGSSLRTDDGPSTTDESYVLPPPVALVDGPTRSGVVAVASNAHGKHKRKADPDEAADTSKMPPPPVPVGAHAPGADSLPPKKKRKSSPGSSHSAPKDSTTSSALSSDLAEPSASDSSSRRTLRSASKRA